MPTLNRTLQKLSEAFKRDGSIRNFGLAVVGDIRSALVASVFAAAGAFIGTVYAQVQESDSFTTTLSNNGVGYPGLLFDQAKREDKKLEITFAPASLERAAVCEYFSERGRTFREIMNKYLKTYSGCFIPVWRDEGKLEIRPNTFTRQLTVMRDPRGRESFWCKCTADQIPVQK